MPVVPWPDPIGVKPPFIDVMGVAVSLGCPPATNVYLIPSAERFETSQRCNPRGRCLCINSEEGVSNTGPRHFRVIQSVLWSFVAPHQMWGRSKPPLLNVFSEF